MPHSVSHQWDHGILCKPRSDVVEFKDTSVTSDRVLDHLRIDNGNENDFDTPRSIADAALMGVLLSDQPFHSLVEHVVGKDVGELVEKHRDSVRVEALSLFSFNSLWRYFSYPQGCAGEVATPSQPLL